PKKTSGCASCFAICLVVFVLFVILGAFKSGSTTSSNPSAPRPTSTPTEIVSNSAWDGSVRQVEKYLKANLRDPDSYQSIEWYKVTKNNEGRFTVRHKYRAKNGFGGYNVVDSMFLLSSSGDVISELKLNR